MTGNDTSKTSPLHPAFTVSNIKNHVPITLEIENVHYASWAELFLNAAQAFDVADHIDPPKGAVINKDGKWTRLDVIVKQWIYATISLDLLHTILKPGATAKEAWDRLKDIFNDNKNSRAVHLEQEFSQVHMDNYPNVSAYCQAVKMLADQLDNVGAPVSEERLVLRLIGGLSKGYDTVASVIQQRDPLPQFYKARSMLTLEESRQNKNNATVSDSALLANNETRGDNSNRSSDSNSNRNNNQNNSNRNKGNRGKNYRGKGHGGGGSSSNRDSSKQQGNGQQQQQQGNRAWAWVPLTRPPWQQQQQAWAVPPCPYPTSGWAPPAPNRGPGILGPHPQAFIAQSPSAGVPQGALVPTDIAAAMQTMTLQQPDENWYLDTGASSHMTSNEGTLVSYFNLSNGRKIIVGNGTEIPILGCGAKTLPSPMPPLLLKNVLHAPNIIKNLVSVRKLTTDNNVSVEFDPFGFTVKDLRTGKPLLRRSSTGDLYPLFKAPTPTSTSPQALAVITAPTWHDRLGHPGPAVFSVLRNNNVIPSKLSSNIFCHSCQLGKHVKLPFSLSTSHTLFPFDIMTTRAMHGIFKPKPQFDLSVTTTLAPIPKNPIAALHDPHWKQAMTDEFDALLKNKTWVLVPRPSNVNITRCIWLFKHKFKSNGDLERYKARLVVNGRSQQVGIDCDETFSTVVKPATIRTVLSIAISKQWHIHQLDVKNAFLHGHLAETVYMHQPPGFRDPKHPDHVCLLQKSLYGLKQAPRAWYQRFATFVKTIGFTHSICDNSLFILHKGTDTAYILLYVDDIILASSSGSLRDSIIRHLRSEFAMSDLGPLNYFLGVSAIRHKHGLFLHQRKYAEKILSRANMTNCKPARTPVDTKPKLGAAAGAKVTDATLYRSLAGALQYLTFTRPDISYAVQQICLHMHDPRTAHFAALKRIIRYVQGTKHLGLHITKSTVTKLTAYTDADWGGCPDSRRSTSGYCVYLGDNLVSWSSKR
ncbi:uncharacterized protein LOC141646388 [Silene latifolia]|uniref:uncharacterized protein LOC141646388 n=1 Tax=Silene latifolia TaxID=37657 RepID=UPI003D783B30